MSRTRYRFGESLQPHFLTCTVVAWLPVFTRPEAVKIVLDSWRFLQAEGRMKLLGYVILENHLHFIAAAHDLSKEVGDFKSFTAKELIQLLQAAGAKTLLEQLEHYKLRHKVDQNYQLWQEESAEGDCRRRHAVAEAGVHARQSGEARLRGRPAALEVFERAELCSAAWAD